MHSNNHELAKVNGNNQELSVEELAKVSGGQNDAAAMFQQILNQLSGN